MLEETYLKIQGYLGPPSGAGGAPGYFPQPPSATAGAAGALQGDKGPGLNPQLVEAASKADAKLKVSLVACGTAGWARFLPGYRDGRVLTEAPCGGPIRAQKLSTMIVKEFDAAAREMLKKELSALAGGAEWGLDALGEGA